jgi:sister-chromatid-cohesion protein PDS5
MAYLNDDSPAILDIFHALLNRSCPLILNKSNVPHLLIISKAPPPQSQVRETRRSNNAVNAQRPLIAQELLKEISTIYPTMYNTNMKDILQGIMDDNDSSAAADESLELLSEISKASKCEMEFEE